MVAIKCSRCSMHDVLIHGAMCNVCQMNITFNKLPSDRLSEGEKMEHYVNQRMMVGCRECGNKNFGFNAGVKEEAGLKWFMMYVECPECKEEYVDVMEVDSVNDVSECE